MPEWHPEHATFTPFDVFAFVIEHPDGVIIVDTGVGMGNPNIDALYNHTTVDLIDELHRLHIDERDVQLIINSHLHFDHCGQNDAFDAPICAQQSEVEAAAAPLYTIAEWATISHDRSRLANGDTNIASGVDLFHTPGHTPGHQAVVIREQSRKLDGDDTVVIAAQCIFTSSEWADGVSDNNLHAPEWRAAAIDSVQRLKALRPSAVYLSHDAPLHLST